MTDLHIRLKLLNARQKNTLKHLRGRHDQRDHNRWPAGYVAQSYVPTGRRGDLMTSRASGQIGRGIQGTAQVAMLANQMSIPWSPTSQFATQDDLIAHIRSVQEKRNSQRLPFRYDILQHQKEFAVPKARGISGVKALSINGEPYFYREYPEYWRKAFGSIVSSNSANNWSIIPTYLNTIVADDLSSAMGLNIAPVSQVSSTGYTIARGLDLDTSVSVEDIVISFLSPVIDSQEYRERRRTLEPLAVLDLILGNNDNHAGNFGVIQIDDGNGNTYPQFAGYDYDLSGGSTKRVPGKQNGSTPVNLWIDLINNSAGKKPLGEKGFLSDDMRQILSVLPQTIQWNDTIPEDARKQILDRVNHLLYLDSTHDSFSGTMDIQDEMYNFSKQNMENDYPDGVKRLMNSLRMHDVVGEQESAIIKPLSGLQSMMSDEVIAQMFSYPEFAQHLAYIKAENAKINTNAQEILKAQNNDEIKDIYRQTIPVSQEYSDIVDEIGNSYIEEYRSYLMSLNARITSVGHDRKTRFDSLQDVAYSPTNARKLLKNIELLLQDLIDINDRISQSSSNQDLKKEHAELMLRIESAISDAVLELFKKDFSEGKITDNPANSNFVKMFLAYNLDEPDYHWDNGDGMDYGSIYQDLESYFLYA